MKPADIFLAVLVAVIQGLAFAAKPLRLAGTIAVVGIAIVRL